MRGSSGKYDRVVQIVALVCALASPFWVWALFFSSTDYDYSMGLALVPVIVLVNLILVIPAGRKDPFLSRALPVALLCKLAATGAYMWIVFHVYNEAGDVMIYWGRGAWIADNLMNYGQWTTLHPVWSSNFIYMLTGLVFCVTTPSLPAGAVLYAMAAFWGAYFFYRAFTTEFPQGNHRLAGLLFFFLPSIVFWTATIGKDALVFLFLGLAAYGFVLLHKKGGVLPFFMILLGTAGVGLARPHIAAMLGVGFLMAYLLGQNRLGLAGTLSKLLGVPLMLGSTLWLGLQAQSFLKMEDISQARGVLERVSAGNYIGGSAFGANTSLAYRLLNVPFLFFRPWPWEVHNLQAVVAAMEGLLLLWIFVRRRRDFYAAVRSWRRNPYVLFSLLFAIQFSVVMSLAITNFGLLTRERVMLLPFVVMLFCTRGQPVPAPVPAVQYAGWRDAPAPQRSMAYRSRLGPGRGKS